MVGDGDGEPEVPLGAVPPLPNPLVVATLDAMQDLTALAVLKVFWEIRMTAAAEHEEHREILRLSRTGKADETERLMHEPHQLHSLERIAATSRRTAPSAC